MKSKRFAVWSFLAAIVAGAVTAFAPLGRVTEGQGTPGGVEVTRSYGVSVFSHDGPWVLVVVAVPILIALAGALIPARAARIVSTVLLWAFCFLGLLSVGLFFLPSAVLMTVAATRPDDRQPAPNPS
jgi:amino acid transporter